MKNKIDYKSFTIEELKSKCAELENTLEKMKLNHTISPLENPLTIRYTRKEVARLQTEINKKATSEK